MNLIAAIDQTGLPAMLPEIGIYREAAGQSIRVRIIMALNQNIMIVQQISQFHILPAVYPHSNIPACFVMRIPPFSRIFCSRKALNSPILVPKNSFWFPWQDII